MNILLTGGTGFVGQALSAYLHTRNDHTYILTRSPENHKNTNQSTFISYQYPPEELPVIHAVINLAGESLFGYWSEKKKQAILNSRIQTTERLIAFIKRLPTLPDVFISGSAVGYYGISEDLMFSENTSESGDDFLSHVTSKWEKTASQAEDLGIRTLYTRFGIVLGKDGALPFMSLPVKLFAGGKIGNGEQWLSWIHIEDAVKLIVFCLDHPKISGPVNVTAPHPKQNKAFMKILAKVLKRPYWLPVPSPFIFIAAGEMSQLITKGQYVIPKKALDHQFSFAFPYLEEALKNIYRS
ncbi:TIGR01777 family oxidoreductase [Virgibacillus salexigens]|uniref:Epimerase family protein n=1 Tax=Virgibacillus massiliensis TaxID=1462526 RepID=A0A024QJH0_9BACI|nr:TIGR01777 family oxidoreductase [Virgibacillus massiliensis]CDQ42086.1 Epimerase family protein [Virgibacillus massiliensis]